jgi:RNA polymerase sigma factor (sigma-70 family)
MGRSLEDVLGCLRKVVAVQSLGRLSDSELLERFLHGHDESAFTVLIERHGPMVFGVCRRSLPNLHDAEDACQATFLVLARQVASLRNKESLSSWLHGVACRIATGLKRHAARRRNREQQARCSSPIDPPAEASQREIHAVLDEELGRLPEWYRAPLILCYLERLTREAAAAQLGLSPGSLHGRLERGRDLLRQRLTKRGLTLSAVVAGAAMSESAALPATFVVTSAKAAALVAAGQPLTELVGASALTLTREVLKSMSLAKLKLGTAALLCTALLALVGGVFVSRGEAQDTTKAKPIAPIPLGESDEEFIRRLSKDLRGTQPTPTEIHFFKSSKEPDKRKKLIDLLIQERQAPKTVEDKHWETWNCAKCHGEPNKPQKGSKPTEREWSLHTISRHEALDRLYLDLVGARDQKKVKDLEEAKAAYEKAIAILEKSEDLPQIQQMMAEWLREKKVQKEKLQPEQAKQGGLDQDLGKLREHLLTILERREAIQEMIKTLEEQLLVLRQHTVDGKASIAIKALEAQLQALKQQEKAEHLKNLTFNQALSELRAEAAKERDKALKLIQKEQAAKEHAQKQAKEEAAYDAWVGKLKSLSTDFTKQMQAAKTKEEVDKVIQRYMDALKEFENAQPKK